MAPEQRLEPIHRVETQIVATWTYFDYFSFFVHCVLICLTDLAPNRLHMGPLGYFWVWN